ncbi:MAG: hypothetical protein C0483_02060 [Pirellula sp.]|nr:hypothetical protein [Pirellula sp.]
MTSPLFSSAAAETSAERGFRYLTTKAYLTPDFDQEVFDKLYTTWEPAAREAAQRATPAERRALTFARYGLSEFPDSPRATALQYTPAPAGGWTMNCLACHTGRVAGRVVFGAPNTQYLLQTLTEDVRTIKFATGKKFTHMDKGSLLYPLGGSIGTTNAVMFGHILLNFRDPDLTFHADRPLPKLTHHDADAIPWWHYKYKTKLYVDNFAPKNHRALMQFLLIPRNGPQQFAAWEREYQDVEAWITSLEAPKYPFAIDDKLATAGYQVFEKNCADCHGRYRAPTANGSAPSLLAGEGAGERRDAAATTPHVNSYPTHSTLLSYPERIIPRTEIGTDPVRLDAMSRPGREKYAATWFTHFGNDVTDLDPGGYVAPPLEGVWASAPYFHNGSVPTLAAVLESSTRPKIWRRTLDGYDQTKIGLEAESLSELPPADAKDYRKRRLYFDTSLPGKSAAGHTFPDALDATQRRAVLEYLKTL